MKEFIEVGQIVINNLTGKKCEIIAIMNRNWYEKSPNMFDKNPLLSGNSVILRDIETKEFEDVYEWEITKDIK